MFITLGEYTLININLIEQVLFEELTNDSDENGEEYVAKITVLLKEGKVISLASTDFEDVLDNFKEIAKRLEINPMG